MKNEKYISVDENNDGIDRAGFLEMYGMGGAPVYFA